MARLVDIAAITGVSPGLVSRVLNDAAGTRATDETRQRILAAAAELGYRPNYAARALRLARSHTLGLAVPDVTNALFAPLVAGVEDAAERHGFMVLFSRTEVFTDHRRITRLLDEGRVDGFLLQGRDDATNEAMTRLLGDSPAVVMNCAIKGRPGSVTLDDAAAARLATEHLIAQGHTRIGLVNGLRTSLTARRRAQGFRAAMDVAGLDGKAPPITWRGYFAADGPTGLDELRLRSPGTTAVVVANVNAALGLLTAARHRSLAVPRDLSVVAIHDAWTADHSWPPVTTVRTPLYALGAKAVDILAAQLDGARPIDVVIDDQPPQLIERESVTRPARRRGPTDQRLTRLE